MDLGEEKLAFARRFGTTIDQCERGRSGSSDSDLTNGRVDYAIDAIGLRRTKEQILRPTINGLFRSSVEEAPGIKPPKTQAILERSLFIGSRNLTRTSGGDWPNQEVAGPTKNRLIC